MACAGRIERAAVKGKRKQKNVTIRKQETHRKKRREDEAQAQDAVELRRVLESCESWSSPNPSLARLPYPYQPTLTTSSTRLKPSTNKSNQMYFACVYSARLTPAARLCPSLRVFIAVLAQPSWRCQRHGTPTGAHVMWHLNDGLARNTRNALHLPSSRRTLSSACSKTLREWAP